MKPPCFMQVFGDFLGVKRDAGVEEREGKDQQKVKSRIDVGLPAQRRERLRRRGREPGSQVMPQWARWRYGCWSAAAQETGHAEESTAKMIGTTRP